VNILFASVNFLKLAAKWPRLMMKWEDVEELMPAYQTWQDREGLSRKIKMLTFVLLSISLSEHLLSIISVLHFANYCPARKDPIESYLFSASSQIFFVADYSPLLAILGKIQNVLLTFGWSYMDIFVMIIGIGLSTLFERVCKEMERNLEKV